MRSATSSGCSTEMPLAEADEARARARAEVRAEMIERARLTMDAAMRPPRWKPGNKHSKGGMTKVYHLARRVLFDHSPEMVAELIDLALNCPDDRVRSGCLIAA